MRVARKIAGHKITMLDDVSRDIRACTFWVFAYLLMLPRTGQD
jgi:hypothetical protein